MTSLDLDAIEASVRAMGGRPGKARWSPLTQAEALGLIERARRPYQHDVHAWMMACFGPEVAFDTTERNYRFLEEALELVQANGCSKADALRLVDYVFARPVGEPDQEVGGVMVCLAALCNAAGLKMLVAGERELERINRPEVMARIKAKHAAKHAAKDIRSPLPGILPAASPELGDDLMAGSVK